MARYSVEIVQKAEKEYLKLPQSVKRRIQELIISFELQPRPPGSKKLKETAYYRVRSGDFRIVYSIDDKSRIVKILSIATAKKYTDHSDPHSAVSAI
jgi:mRNA interferase RelE/StbE